MASALARLTASLLDGALTVMTSTRSVGAVTVYVVWKLLMLSGSPNLARASPATARLCAMDCSLSMGAPEASPGAACGVRRSDVDA